MERQLWRGICEKTGDRIKSYLENYIRTATENIYPKNPALMTREISEYAEKDGLFVPYNQPEPLTTSPTNSNLGRCGSERAKRGFEEEARNGINISICGPLYVGKKCPQCHAKQGWDWQVRGGISVSFDIRKSWVYRIIYHYCFSGDSHDYGFARLYLSVASATERYRHAGSRSK
jgi:hypothetical protein